MADNASSHPDRPPGYDDDPLTHRPELVDQPLFWLGHLYSMVEDEETEELLFGADADAADDFHQRLHENGGWPTFTVPLTGGRLYVVHRTGDDDPGTDFLLHGPGWDRAEPLACVDGHFMGPGLSWPELVAAADTLPGGSTDDPDSRLLLLLPAFGDSAVPDGAAERLAAALRSRTGVEDPDALAAALLERQGPWGPVRWTTTEDGSRTNDGGWSSRNPGNHFAWSPERLSRVSAALTP
ncbi:hypothetical protein KIK06_14745 [Nocardiopsis sp. EMB25]|uniref:hypothetical protein n=1 Tax=Nocardiopsis sp. EMB25 TaxID=2835867 RepID=UPI0022837C8F|nr:hypothetical protein [Nocardiopsis sp. EMB25]MCY9785141.1 hypothetical protein [Nocardiopsis sp. EMB25]